MGRTQPTPVVGDGVRPPTLARHERRAWAVASLAAVATLVELAAGVWTGSAALLAEGLHMGAHVAAFLLAALAYACARGLARAKRSRAVEAVPDLAALLNGLLMLGLGVGLGVESLDALRHPHAIAYGSALSVAVFGLAVNVACAALLHHDPAHEAGHGRDLNFRAIYLHIVADGAVAALAIVGLLLGRGLGWRWTDPAASALGAALVIILGGQVALRSLTCLIGGRGRAGGAAITTP